MKFAFDTRELYQGVSGSYLGPRLAASYVNISISDQISVISFSYLRCLAKYLNLNARK